MNEKELENLKENKHYGKIKQAAIKTGITPEEALEFIDDLIKIPLSNTFATEDAARHVGISLDAALEFKKNYFLLTDNE